MKYNIYLSGEFDASTLTTSQLNFLKLFAANAPEVKGEIKKKELSFEEYWHSLDKQKQNAALRYLETRNEVLVPPCYIGQKFYVVDDYSNTDTYIDKYTVSKLSYDGYQWTFYTEDEDDFSEDAIEDTVFFSYEEAKEAAEKYL